MEEKLSELETVLRAHLDRLGMKPIDKDWHYEDSSLDQDNDDDDVFGIQPFDPEEFRIDFNSEPFAILMMSQRRYRPAEVIRGKFSFKEGASECVFILIQLISCESATENGARVQEMKQIWQEDHIFRADLNSDDFSVSLPYGPDACANFRTPVVELQWQLRFQFAINKATVSQAETRPESIFGLIKSDNLRDHFDVIEWELNLEVISKYKKFEEWSRKKLTFYVRESELTEFQVKSLRSAR